MRCAIQKAEGVGSPVDRSGFKRKGAAMRNPARQRGTQRVAQIFAHVQIGDSRTATEPFQYAADGKIYSQGAHINRKGTGALKNVEDYVSANSMRTLDDGADIDDMGAAK